MKINKNSPISLLRHHVTGAIERGKAVAIVEIPAKKLQIPGVRHDRRSNQYYPTVNGIDISPTSVDKDRAMAIAREAMAMHAIAMSYRAS